jgi:hypothetical protein
VDFDASDKTLEESVGMTDPEHPHTDGKSFQERRASHTAKHTLLSDWRWAYKGRRRRPWTGPDGRSMGADRVQTRVLLIAVAILILSGLDATFTLILMQEGIVEEANPLMRWLIEHDVQIFVNVKTVITGAALFLLAACYHGSLLRRLPVRWILRGVLAAYLAVVTFEVVLLAGIPQP